MFWFKPISPASMALFRIFFALALLRTFTSQIDGDFLDWFGPDSAVPFFRIKHIIWEDLPRFDALLLFFPNSDLLKLYFDSLILACLSLLVGFASRFSAGYLCLGLISLQNHDYVYRNGGDNLLRVTSMFLTFSAAGDYLSVDAWLKRKFDIPMVRSKIATWCQRMIQLQVCLAYGHSFFAKVVQPAWWDGTALYYVLNTKDIMHFPTFGLANSIVFCRVITAYTLFVEAAMFTLIWIPVLRPYILGAAILLHLGIDYSLNLPVFEYVFIASLITFVNGEKVEAVINSLKAFVGRIVAKSIVPADS